MDETHVLARSKIGLGKWSSHLKSYKIKVHVSVGNLVFDKMSCMK
jgi:hypothetical protein